MSPLIPPPIGEPESLGELSRLVSYVLTSISQSLSDMSSRLDHVVTRDQHRADLAGLRRELDEAKAEIADVSKACEEAQARSASTVRWSIGSMITIVSIVVTIWLALSGN
ncbi:hypothetical protein JOD54_002189 [Actinokineospora baliensis]|uniref:hypothetical protein n=1 Tax=Actinokineospora baliensis TaxID=547056 RepID=UPI001956E8D0|nr:hypothetical protein [Actinokineospora baliensis]MBM7771985.1 hypothetical protein [Actinokineospora baliensis]